MVPGQRELIYERDIGCILTRPPCRALILGYLSEQMYLLSNLEAALCSVPLSIVFLVASTTWGPGVCQVAFVTPAARHCIPLLSVLSSSSVIVLGHSSVVMGSQLFLRVRLYFMYFETTFRCSKETLIKLKPNVYLYWESVYLLRTFLEKKKKNVSQNVIFLI